MILTAMITKQKSKVWSCPNLAKEISMLIQACYRNNVISLAILLTKRNEIKGSQIIIPKI